VADLVHLCSAVTQELAQRELATSIVHPDRLIAAVADRQSGLITRDQLIALGLGRGAIRRRVQCGLLYALYRGVYLWGHPSPTPFAGSLAAVLACGDGSVLSQHWAAARWGMRPEASGQPDVTIIGRQARPAGVRTHATRHLDRPDIRRLHGMPITNPARTLIDCAADLATRELAGAVEQAQVKGLVTKRELAAALDRAPRRLGARALRSLIDDPAFTRSEAERRLVALLRSAGLGSPAFNHPVRGFEVDAIWHVERVIVEFDSYAFHATRMAFERDRRRDAVLTRAGYVVLRTTWHELTQQPFVLIARIAEALALGAAAPRAGTAA